MTNYHKFDQNIVNGVKIKNLHWDIDIESSVPKLKNFTHIVDHILPEEFTVLTVESSDLSQIPSKEFNKLIQLLKYHCKLFYIIYFYVVSNSDSSEAVFSNVTLTDHQLELIFE